MAIVKAGENIPLSCQLFDGSTSKFVRAELREPGGTVFPGTPLTLTHVGGGLYTDNSLVMPSTEDYLDGIFKVYDDAGLTVKSSDHSDTTEIYQLQVPVSELIEILEKIKEILENGVIARGIFSDVVAIVTDEQIVAHFGEEEPIVIEVPDSDVEASIEEDEVVVDVGDDEIVAHIPCE